MPPKRPAKPAAAAHKNASKIRRVEKAQMEMLACLNRNCKQFEKLAAHLPVLQGVQRGMDVTEAQVDRAIQELGALLKDLKGLPTCAVEKCAKELVSAFEETLNEIADTLANIDVKKPGTKLAILGRLQAKGYKVK